MTSLLPLSLAFLEEATDSEPWSLVEWLSKDGVPILVASLAFFSSMFALLVRSIIECVSKSRQARREDAREAYRSIGPELIEVRRWVSVCTNLDLGLHESIDLAPKLLDALDLLQVEVLLQRPRFHPHLHDAAHQTLQSARAVADSLRTLKLAIDGGAREEAMQSAEETLAAHTQRFKKLDKHFGEQLGHFLQGSKPAPVPEKLREKTA